MQVPGSAILVFPHLRKNLVNSDKINQKFHKSGSGINILDPQACGMWIYNCKEMFSDCPAHVAVYASQQHEQFLPDGTRAGFLIGDGAGVGKGRTIAGRSTLPAFLWLGKKRIR
jgi:hypothetical protein